MVLKDNIPKQEIQISIYRREGGKNEEADLPASIEQEEKSAKSRSRLIRELQKTATTAMLKDQRMNIKLTKRYLNEIKARALEEVFLSSFRDKYRT